MDGSGLPTTQTSVRRAGDADRAVSVFHRGICLGVRERGLAELERGFLGDADAPPVAQEDEVLLLEILGCDRFDERPLGFGDHRPEILAEVRAEQSQRRRREARLNDGTLVGELQGHRLGSMRDARAIPAHP